MNESVRAQQAFRYTLSVLLPGWAGAERAVRYAPPGEPSPDGAAEVCIVPSGFFGPGYLTANVLPEPPLKEIEGVPLLFGRPEVRRQGRRLIVEADIVASTFFLVARCEEVVRREVRDRFGRFPGTQSLPNRAGFIHRPVVDEYARLLRGWLGQAGLAVPAPERRFTVALTHDVDWIRKYAYRLRRLRTGLSAVLGLQPWQNFREVLRIAAGRQKDPFDKFDELIEADAALCGSPHDAGPPIYFFLAGGRGPLDGRYDIRGRLAAETLRKVRDAGAAVGLHVSYQAGCDPRLIAGEKAALEQVVGAVTCSRHHFLGWLEIEAGWSLAEAGITDDYTLGYADTAGFRLGVCRPVRMFDPVRMQPMGLTAHPLVVMDATLSAAEYMHLDEEAAFDCCRRLIERTREHHGEFVVLWHNTSFAPGPGNYLPRLYARLVALLGGRGNPSTG